MITTKDPALTVYPNREQMLALIQARAAVDAGDPDKVDERRSAASETPFTVCIFVLAD